MIIEHINAITYQYNNISIQYKSKKMSKLCTSKKCMIVSCAYGDIQTVKKCIENCMNINKQIRGNIKKYYLHIACKYGQLDIVKLLMENGANIHSKNIIENTSIIIACMKGHKDIVKYLLDKGANVNDTNWWDHTSIYYACLYNHYDIVKMLIENGANIYTKYDLNTISLFIIACRKSHIEIAKLLINNGIGDEYYAQCMLKACVFNKHDVMKMLIEHCTDVNKLYNDKYNNTQNLLSYTCQYGMSVIIIQNY